MIVGVPPFGCLPIAITLYSNRILDHNRECITTMSSVAQDFNQLVTQKVKEMQGSDSKIYHVDIYKTLLNIIRDPEKLGMSRIYSVRLAYLMIKLFISVSITTSKFF